METSEYKPKRMKKDGLASSSSSSKIHEEPDKLPYEIFELEAAAELLGNILNAPFFNSLRTEQVLGYTITTKVVFYFGRPSLQFTVVSKTSPIEIETQIHWFLNGVPALIRSMNAEQYHRVKKALFYTLVKTSPTELFKADMNEIQLNRHKHIYKNKVASTMLDMEQETLAKLAESYVIVLGAASRHLSVHMWVTYDSADTVIDLEYNDLSNEQGTIVCSGLECEEHMENVSSTWRTVTAEK